MLARIVRSLLTLVALLLAYQVYALVAVPLLEPPVAMRKVRQSTDAEREQARQAPNKYQRLLAAYFPPDHWSQTRPPKVVESGPVMLVLEDYRRHDDGRVDLTQCAMLFFPTPRQDGVEPPRDAVVIEAPQGAHFQFDGKFQPERGHIPEITRGQMPGRITIRSDMHEPGPEDDLLVETNDVEMNSKLLYTNSPVSFRMGANVGGGRELEIRFLVEEHARPGSSNWAIAGVDSLEIRREVRLHVLLEAKNLLPTTDRREPQSAGDAPPVEVTCSGPFHFDFVRYVASFDRDVELWQINASGPGDQLSCQQLDLFFAPRAEPAGGSPEVSVDPGSRQKRDLRRLEPAKIVARGHPVIVTSPSHAAEARGGRIQLGLRERKVAIDGGSDVQLVYGPNVLRAPAIQYEQPPKDAATRIGSFWADGPGSLYYVPDVARPDQTLEATWQTSVELGRHNGQPVLALRGRPQLAFAALGRLVADQMQIFLRELQGTPTAGAAIPVSSSMGSSRLQVVPDRMTAIGRVEFESPQLTGRTHELAASFRAAPESGRAVGGGTAATEQLNLAGQNGRPGQVYQIEADHLRLDVALRGQGATATSLACEGNVALRQLSNDGMNQQPVEVRGGQLTATDLDSAAHIRIAGNAPGEPAGSRLAQLQVSGVTMLAGGAELDQSQNRLWSDGPGKATMLLARDLGGHASASPYPLEITWNGGLEFNGRDLVFDRQVLVQGADEWLRCQQLVARLTVPVKFGARIDRNAVELGEIECRGHVVMDRRGRDVGGPTSHERAELEQLLINQQTGAVTGTGPGSVRSTHLSSATATVMEPSVSTGAGPQLHFLRVDFERGLVGNLYLRELSFRQRVRTVYGAIDSWEQELDIDRPESWPPGSVTLTCDELGLNEDPVAAQAAPKSDGEGKSKLGPLELMADGNVRIEGQSTAHGTFAAQADRATYQQAKDLFVLEGSQRTPATIWQQRQLGGQFAQNSARKIQYWRSTGQVKVEDIRVFEFAPPTAPVAVPQNARSLVTPAR